MVSGVAEAQAAEFVVNDLVQQGYPSEVLKAAQLGVPGYLIGLLRDIHSHTWYSLNELDALDHLAVAHKGTRPGSPLADAIFHLMMHSMVQEFLGWAHGQDQFMQLNQELDVQAEPIIWSDDIAIVWATRDGHELPGCLRQIIQVWEGGDLNSTLPAARLVSLPLSEDQAPQPSGSAFNLAMMLVMKLSYVVSAGNFAMSLATSILAPTSLPNIPWNKRSEPDWPLLQVPLQS